MSQPIVSISQVGLPRNPPPPTWGVSRPLSVDRYEGQGTQVLSGATGGESLTGAWSRFSSDPEEQLRRYLEALEQIEALRQLMAETFAHWYWVNGFVGSGGPRQAEGIHEWLFPQYFKGEGRCVARDRLDPLSRPWEAVSAAASQAIALSGNLYPCRVPSRSMPPNVGVATGLRPPIAPQALSEQQLSALPPPPLPDRLLATLKRAFTTPVSDAETAEHFYAADRNLSPERVQEALSQLPELEQALGMSLAKTPGGDYGTRIDVNRPGGYEALAADRLDHGTRSTATGAYLVRLMDVYQQYKAEYYGLDRAIRHDLYHREPCSLRPPVQHDQALAYLEEKYAPAMEGLIWRTTRTSSPIMLDLDGDGQLAVTGKSTAKERAAGHDFVSEGSVSFDLDGDGVKEQIEWMAGDGMLVDDRDGGASRAAAGSGEIDGTRLFGDEGGTYANGYEKLRAHDVDGDGRLTGDELSGLKVWVDDGDARLEAGELKTLAELAITELGARMQEVSNAQGERLMRSTFVQDGETKVTEDVWFARG